MFGPSITSRHRSRQPWIRAVIFVGLYSVVLLSLSQCALVLYLYGTAQVDGLMTPSLVIGLIASFLSVPFVIIHTVLAWQYRQSPALNIPRNASLHMACSYLPRIMVAMWLAAAVAGMVVVSKQATCEVAIESQQQYWKAGLSCQIYRGAVVIDTVAFMTTFALFFCYQVCERPYDASLLGVYTPQRPPRDGSIFSESSWESETLKNEILYLCRHPDAGPGNGELYWSPNDSSLFETPVRPPSIRYPGPARVRPQLRVSCHTNSVRPSIIAPSDSSGSDKLVRVSSTNQPVTSLPSNDGGVSPLSRNPSLSSSIQPGTEAALTRTLTVPPVPKIPEDVVVAPLSTKVGKKHARQKSSVSSRKFLPKDWLSEPLSEDPQIRALASPHSSPEIKTGFDSSRDLSKPEESVSIQKVPSPPQPAAQPTASPASGCIDEGSRGGLAQTRRHSNTGSGSPPSVLPPVPLTVRKSRTSYIQPTRSIHHPHHPNYIPPVNPPKPFVEEQLGPRYNHNESLVNIAARRQVPLQRHKSTIATTSARLPPQQHHHHQKVQPGLRFPNTLTAYGSSTVMHRGVRPSASFRGNNRLQPLSRIPSHRERPPPSSSLQYAYSNHNHNHNPNHNHNNNKTKTAKINPSPLSGPAPTRPPLYTRRFHSNDGRGFDPSRTLPPIPRSDDTVTLYPSTRRPRSSTYAGLSSAAATAGATAITSDTGGLDILTAATTSTNKHRTSLRLADGGVALEEDTAIVERRNTYRGAERTSFSASNI